MEVAVKRRKQDQQTFGFFQTVCIDTSWEINPQHKNIFAVFERFVEIKVFILTLSVFYCNIEVLLISRDNGNTPTGALYVWDKAHTDLGAKAFLVYHKLEISTFKKALHIFSHPMAHFLNHSVKGPFSQGFLDSLDHNSLHGLDTSGIFSAIVINTTMLYLLSLSSR